MHEVCTVDSSVYTATLLLSDTLVQYARVQLGRPHLLLESVLRDLRLSGSIRQSRLSSSSIFGHGSAQGVTHYTAVVDTATVLALSQSRGMKGGTLPLSVSPYPEYFDAAAVPLPETTERLHNSAAARTDCLAAQ